MEVPTLEDTETLQIPEGTQTGARFRIRGKGIPLLNGHGRGDLYVYVRVETPINLTKEQRKLLQQLDALTRPDNRPVDKSFTDKVKDLFS